MLDLILKVIRALLASLYMLFEGMPALEALRSWFGERVAEGRAGAQLLTLMAGAALVSVVAFLALMWWLSRRPPSLRSAGKGSRTRLAARPPEESAKITGEGEGHAE